MPDLQRAIFATAILELDPAAAVAVLFVAGIAKVVRSEAVVQGHRAAEHALPVDMLSAMLLADLLASAHVLQEARLAA